MLRIKGLRVSTSIGAGDDERAEPQIVVIDADVSLDMSRAGNSDVLGDTLDYGSLLGAIEILAAEGERKLLERLAEEIAELILDREGVTAAVVEITKANVPVPQTVAAVSVRVIRVKPPSSMEDV